MIMKYSDVVKNAQKANRIGYGKVSYQKCDIWVQGDQINLWTYWQGYQLKDIDKLGVDVLLVGQDWGNPWRKENNKAIEAIKQMQSGNDVPYVAESSTDQTLREMFRAFGSQIDIMNKKPGMRLFFTNYSLGYRSGKESGGMTKTLMLQDRIYFEQLVEAISPRIIICLGKITYEVVSGCVEKDYIKLLSTGIPLKSNYSIENTGISIPVYGVAHCGSWGKRNIGGENTMKKAWNQIAKEYFEM